VLPVATTTAGNLYRGKMTVAHQDKNQDETITIDIRTIDMPLAMTSIDRAAAIEMYQEVMIDILAAAAAATVGEMKKRVHVADRAAVASHEAEVEPGVIVIAPSAGHAVLLVGEPIAIGRVPLPGGIATKAPATSLPRTLTGICHRHLHVAPERTDPVRTEPERIDPVRTEPEMIDPETATARESAIMTVIGIVTAIVEVRDMRGILTDTFLVRQNVTMLMVKEKIAEELLNDLGHAPEIGDETNGRTKAEIDLDRARDAGRVDWIGVKTTSWFDEALGPRRG
jgi:hypothetical protein